MLWPYEFKDLVGLVKPIMDPSLLGNNHALFNSLFSSQHNTVLVDDVIDNLHHLVYNQKEINTAILNKIYEYLLSYGDKSQLKLKLKQKQITDIYDGIDSYRPISSFILKSSLCDLSPFYFVPSDENQFVNKFKQLYTGLVFDCTAQLTHDMLVALINEKISKVDDISLSNHTLVNQIRSIYSIIEEVYDSDAILNFLLPVYDYEGQKAIKFEKAESCVFLNDDMDDKEDALLEYKLQTCREMKLSICNDEKLISRKFLKKIGIKSFTERIMNIESLGMQSYGQYEELTDRLKILLNGYKDGKPMFKEIIQVN
jgi:hypothetical protein